MFVPEHKPPDVSEKSSPRISPRAAALASGMIGRDRKAFFPCMEKAFLR
jgi:hypothetical protein